MEKNDKLALDATELEKSPNSGNIASSQKPNP
jgi:hypothetical protein